MKTLEILGLDEKKVEKVVNNRSILLPSGILRQSSWVTLGCKRSEFLYNA